MSVSGSVYFQRQNDGECERVCVLQRQNDGECEKVCVLPEAQ